MISAITIISIIISAIYCTMIIVFAIAFINKKKSPSCKGNAGIISIIIACRNEEKNIKNLLKSLIYQEYENEFEIIIIDDHSTDSTLQIIKEINDKRVNLICLPTEFIGKKAALKFGVSKSKGDILLFTDADCIIPKNWISNMANKLAKKNIDMLCGPVAFNKEKHFLNNLFRLEFISLTGSGASGFFINKPFLCNGANYAIRRNLYQKSIDKINDNYSSGDDIFLLQHISKNGKAEFFNSPEVIVQTNAPSNLREFFKQRIRWASKTTGYKDFFPLFVAITSFSMSLITLALPIIAIFYYDLWKAFLILIFSKTIIDTLMLTPMCKFHNQTKLIFSIPILQIFHPIYIIITAVLSLFYKPYWKGRKIKA